MEKVADTRPSGGSSNYEYRQDKRIAHDLTEALGIVPILKLGNLAEVCQVHDFYLKLEACNPGGSIKDKNAAVLIKDAEAKGLLKPGGTIVESSSGNFGIGLAMLGAARGYRVMIVIDAKTPPPMKRMLKAYGAELVDVPLSLADANGSMQVARMGKARELANEIPGAWYPCQHLNPLTPEAHALYTAREIAAAFTDLPDVIFIGVSTCGQLGGISRYFKKHFPSVEIVGVDVAGSAIFGTPRHSYKMTGLGLSFKPPAYDPTALAGAYSVTDQVAFSVCRELARKEGLLLGASTGAIVAAGLAYGMNTKARKRLLLLNPDRGDRYLETVFCDEWLEEQGISVLRDQKLTDALAKMESITPEKLREDDRE